MSQCRCVLLRLLFFLWAFFCVFVFFLFASLFSEICVFVLWNMRLRSLKYASSFTSKNEKRYFSSGEHCTYTRFDLHTRVIHVKSYPAHGDLTSVFNREKWFICEQKAEGVSAAIHYGSGVYVVHRGVHWQRFFPRYHVVCKLQAYYYYHFTICSQNASLVWFEFSFFSL